MDCLTKMSRTGFKRINNNHDQMTIYSTTTTATTTAATTTTIILPWRLKPTQLKGISPAREVCPPRGKGWAQ